MDVVSIKCISFLKFFHLQRPTTMINQLLKQVANPNYRYHCTCRKNPERQCGEPMVTPDLYRQVNDPLILYWIHFYPCSCGRSGTSAACYPLHHLHLFHCSEKSARWRKQPACFRLFSEIFSSPALTATGPNTLAPIYVLHYFPKMGHLDRLHALLWHGGSALRRLGHWDWVASHLVLHQIGDGGCVVIVDAVRSIHFSYVFSNNNSLFTIRHSPIVLLSFIYCNQVSPYLVVCRYVGGFSHLFMGYGSKK